VASDGGIFTFGDAAFHGSTGSVVLNKPIVGMGVDTQTGGYWLAASDGGLFNFDAPFLGSAGAQPITAPVIALMSTSHGFPFPPGSSGYDVSKWNCGALPPGAKSFAVVQIAGATGGYLNPCYATEAEWAGSNMAAYIYTTELPALGEASAMTGPAGHCGPADSGCQSYNYGYYWARSWVATSRSQGIYPNLWFLDVEQPPTWGNFPPSSNARLISGEVAGLRSYGVIPGIYSLPYQWGVITGGLQLPGIALWIPGAGNISTPTDSAPSALQICAGSAPLYTPFAGGVPVLVQTGWFSSPYPGKYLTDYAC
jgi:hypothetical protein